MSNMFSYSSHTFSLGNPLVSFKPLKSGILHFIEKFVYQAGKSKLFCLGLATQHNTHAFLKH